MSGGRLEALRMTSGAFVVLSQLVVGACATTSAPRQADTPVEQEPDADDLFAAGEYSRAIGAYARQIDETSDSDERARLRLFRALARLAAGDARAEAEAVGELRAIEIAHGTTLWGRIARVHVLEIARRDALREAIMQAGVSLRETELELQRVRDRLLEAEAGLEEQEKAIGSLKDERKKLQRQLETLTEQAQVHAERMGELQRELEALKQIDMKRKP
jgi:chromosome segregation ATPase